MSWLYLPVQVEACLPQNGYLDGEPSATSKTQNIPLKSSRLESGIDCSTTHPSGTMLEHSTGNPGVDAWILSLRDSRASRSVQQESNGEQMMSETCGLTLFALLEKSSPDTAYWKTSQVSLPGLMGISERYSESWPKAGMMQDGVCYLRQKWERRIAEIGSGLWPTPRAREPGDTIESWMRRHLQPKNKKMGPSLSVMVKAINQRKYPHLWPTPLARDARTFKGNVPPPNHQGDKNLGKTVGGTLNPMWVEWLMGWPIGWTDLNPLAMDRFQQWLQSFGSYW
jgi:hypothetical protein